MLRATSVLCTNTGALLTSTVYHISPTLSTSTTSNKSLPLTSLSFLSDQGLASCH